MAMELHLSSLQKAPSSFRQRSFVALSTSAHVPAPSHLRILHLFDVAFTLPVPSEVQLPDAAAETNVVVQVPGFVALVGEHLYSLQSSASAPQSVLGSAVLF
jgi:hypothetical protein